MDEGKRKALESLPRPSPIGLSQSMWTTICPFDPEVKLGGDADDGRHLTIVGTSAAAADTMVWIGPFTGMSKPGQGKRKEKYGRIPKDSHGMMVDVVSPCSCRFVGGRLVQMTFRFHFRSCLIDRSSLLRQFRRTQKHDCQKREKGPDRATAPNATNETAPPVTSHGGDEHEQGGSEEARQNEDPIFPYSSRFLVLMQNACMTSPWPA